MNASAGWENFLVAEVGASAALAGLLFVAVSINVTKILEYKTTVSRAAEALLLLLSVLFAGSFALVPRQSNEALGAELLGTGLVLCCITLSLQLHQINKGQQQWWWLPTRMSVCQSAMLSFCITGVLLLAHNPGGMYWFLPACLLAFIGGVTSAWVLLIEILR